MWNHFWWFQRNTEAIREDGTQSLFPISSKVAFFFIMDHPKILFQEKVQPLKNTEVQPLKRHAQNHPKRKHNHMIWIPHIQPLISKVKAHCTHPQPGRLLRVGTPRPHHMVYQTSLPFALREWVPMVKGQLPLANPTPQSRSIKPGWERPCHSRSWSPWFHVYLRLPQGSRQLGLGKDLQGSSIILSQAFLLKYRVKPISLVGQPYSQEYFNLGISVPRGLSLMPAVWGIDHDIREERGLFSLLPCSEWLAATSEER